MQIITPDYYQNFKCIAGRCTHNCCIGWEIEIDDDTLKKYNNINGDFSSRLKSNINFSESPHFKLDKNDRCPFLNKSGLCDIITNLGEDMLCQICADHPRFRNFYEDFTELGLGLCCEAAAEIILTNKEKVILQLPHQADSLPIIIFREKIFRILQNRNKSIDNRVNDMLSLIDARLPENTDWYSVLSGLEKIDNCWGEYLLRIKDGIDSPTQNNSLDTAYEQLIVYLIFRHFTDCQYDDMVKERILFAALIYKIIKRMNTSNTLEELIQISRSFSCEIEYSDENIDKILSALS